MFGSLSLCLVLGVCFAVLVSDSAGADSSQCVNSTLNCSELCIPVFPPSNTFLVAGQKMNFSVEPLTPILLYRLRKDGQELPASTCGGPPEHCILDSDAPRLEITSFNQSISAGAYRFDVTAGTLNAAQKCEFYFNISQGVAPTIAKENNPQMILDADSGKLELNPVINHGIPRGVVQWTKDGEIILNNNDSLVRSVPVQAEDRGRYRATISNEVGSAYVEYEITINFSPIITLTTDPIDTHPDFVNGGGLTVTCEAIAHPAITSIDLTSDGTSVATTSEVAVALEGDNLHYEAKATYVVSSGCPSESITCSVANSISSVQRNIKICQSTPTITDISIEDETSSNVSARLTWKVNLQMSSLSAIHSFEIRYKRVGDVLYNNLTITDVTSEAISITGLSPGVAYEFSVKLVDISANTKDIFSNSISWTTFRRPINKPTGVNVEGNETSIILKWNKPFGVLDHAPIAGYRVSYSTNDGSSATVFISGSDNTQFVLSPYDKDAMYSFIVWATNDWGEGDKSAAVQYKYREVDDLRPSPFDATVDVAVGNDMVVLSWNIKSDLDNLSRLEVIIRRLQSNGSSVVFYPVTTLNISSLEVSERCFSELNNSQTYQFCLQAHRKDNYEVLPVCEFATTSNQAIRLQGATMCHPVVEPEPLTSDPVIPSWAIAVLVVGCVALVFIFFGGCGLYFGLRRNKKGDLEFDENPEGFDTLSPNSVNGKYPYPPPNQRATSPSSRNCMSYHRNNDRGHHMDWQGVSHV